MKTQLFFFSDLPAVIHTSVIKLLTKPHPVIETLAERTWRLRTIWLLPYCSSMKISHPALFLVTRYSRWSNVLDRFRLNSVRHFCCFYKVVTEFFWRVRSTSDCNFPAGGQATFSPASCEEFHLLPLRRLF